jgi:hypothetical protein
MLHIHNYITEQEGTLTQVGLTQASICPRFYKRFVINHVILATTTGTLYLPKPDKNFRLC